MVKLEMESQALEEATKLANKIETTKKLANPSGQDPKDFNKSLRSQTGLGASGDLSSTRSFISKFPTKLTSANILGEGKPSQKTQQILKLRMQNEDKAVRSAQLREI